MIDDLLQSENPGEHLISQRQWHQIAAALGLTPRERQVTQLLFEGLTREEIARKLHLKPRTVRQYLEQIHSKLNVRNRIGLVLRIIAVRDYLKQSNQRN
jgi:RNA polymerase sigma factor (sigma-70 family)